MMCKSFLFSVAVCLYLISSVPTEASTNYDPFPNCTQRQRSNETKTKLAACSQGNPNSGTNSSDSAACCQYWKRVDCERAVLYALPECKPARFLFELQYDSLKPHSCAKPSAASCLNVTTNAAVETVIENIFHPLEQLFKNQDFANCNRNTEKGMLSICMASFENLMEGTPSEEDLCCDQLNYYYCAQIATGVEPTCEVARTQLESTFQTIKKNVAKKCPNKGPCFKFPWPNFNGSTNVSLAISLFTLSLIVALINTIF